VKEKKEDVKVDDVRKRGESSKERKKTK